MDEETKKVGLSVIAVLTQFMTGMTFLIAYIVSQLEEGDRWYPVKDQTMSAAIVLGILFVGLNLGLMIILILYNFKSDYTIQELEKEKNRIIRS